jgi:hypothetical protein
MRPTRAIFAIAVALACALIGGASSGNARTITCVITPVVREALVNQGGLRSTAVSPLRIVRGKSTLVKIFLSMPQTLPSCAGNGAAIQVTGATLSVTTGGTTLGSGIASTPALPAPPSTYTYPTVSTYAAAPALDSSGDQKFNVAGSVLAPASITGSFTATFTASITYQSKATSSGTYSAGPSPVTGSTSATVEAKSSTHSMRILVTALGLPTSTFDQNFGVDANTAMQNGFAGLAAKAPVQAGIGNLLSDTGGLRYTLNRNGLVDVTNFLKEPTTGVYPSTASTAKFCARGDNFGSATSSGTVAAQLAGQLAAWNAANGPTATNPNAPDHTADASFGVVDALQSLGGSNGCYEGLAAVGGRQAVARAAAGTGSITPAVFSMEWAHMLGLVPTNRDDNFNPTHSPYVTADAAPGDLNRVYNPLTSAVASDNHTVMDFAGTWNGDNTVFERDDYEWLFCALGGTATTECLNAVPSPLGTTVAVASGDTYFLGGTTDGATVDGTHLIEAHPSDAVVRAPAPSSSHYFLRQLKVSGAGTQPLAVDPVSVSFGESHADELPLPGSIDSPIGTVSAAVPAALDANKVVFSRGLPGDVDYAALADYDKSATQPAITSVTNAAIPGPHVAPGGSAGFTSPTYHTATAPTADEDVAFLFDTTGSMGGVLTNAGDKADEIVTAVKNSDPNAQFAVAGYKDFNFASCTPSSSYVYTRAQNLTASSEAIKSAIMGLSASGGCDGPEADFLGLREIADGSTSFNVDFRGETRKNIVWLGDAPSHTPICTAIGNSFDSNITSDITEASVIASMNAKSIKVFPISVGGGLNSAGASSSYPVDCPQDIQANQGSNIADATGGKYQTIAESDTAEAILRALGRRFRVVPIVKSCDPGASLSFSPARKDVDPNKDVDFGATFSAASTVEPGTRLECTYKYVVNDVEQENTYTAAYYVADFGGQQTVTVNGTGNALVDVYVTNCPGDSTIDYPAKLAVSLDEAGRATVPLDASACPGGHAEATVNDAFTSTSLVQSTTTFPAVTERPQVAIQSPTQTTVLSYKPLALRATALPAGATIRWSMDGTNLPTTGGVVDVSPPGPSAGNPSGGWQGPHTFRATATLGLQTSYTEITVTTNTDSDSDGISDSLEQTLPCFVDVTTDTYKPWLDPSNASADYDLDGLTNGDEIAAGTKPCLAETTPLRVTDLIFPFTLDLSSTAATWVVDGMFQQNRPWGDINGASVRITKIAGYDVSSNPDFVNNGWSYYKQIAAGIFRYQKLIAFLKEKNIAPGSRVVLEVSGSSKAAVTPPWSFVNTPTVKVIKSGS